MSDRAVSRREPRKHIKTLPTIVVRSIDGGYRPLMLNIIVIKQNKEMLELFQNVFLKVTSITAISRRENVG